MWHLYLHKRDTNETATLGPSSPASWLGPSFTCISAVRWNCMATTAIVPPCTAYGAASVTDPISA